MVASLGREAFLPLAAPVTRRVIRVGMPTTTPTIRLRELGSISGQARLLFFFARSARALVDRSLANSRSPHPGVLVDRWQNTALCETMVATR